MSRNNKTRRKEKQQQKRRREKLASRRNGAPRWYDVCNRASELFDRRLYQEAREVLEEYESEKPGQCEVLQLLLDVYHQQRDYGPYCGVCRRLVEKQPGNSPLHLMLASGYLADGRLGSALLAFRRFRKLWPNDPLVDGVHNSIAQIESAVGTVLRDLSLTGDDGLELLAMHEEMMAGLASGDDARTIQMGEQIVARRPGFIPALNNLSEAYFRTGHGDKAVAVSRQVLREQPENVHALANLTRHLFLTGHQVEAAALAERLRAAPAERDDAWPKKCEALCFLGADQEVISIFEEAQRAGATKQRTPNSALLFHLAATAFARQGHPRKAARYWRAALKIEPQWELAGENLADAALDVAQRHGPWYFSLKYWGFQESLTKLYAPLANRTIRGNNKTISEEIKRFADAHPEVVRLVPALLDRGDARGREFAWHLAMILETPEMLDALLQFCLSQRGPDSMRVETANRLSRAGALPSGPVRMWLEGRWQHIEIVGFEITTEPVTSSHNPQVEEWADDGCQALREGKGREAEEIFQKCLDVEGEAPDLLNNLAASYEIQGRKDEAHALARHIHEQWPDYFFGRIAMAILANSTGNWELAENYLAPLHRRTQLHLTEFTALANANIQLLLGRGNVDAARKWVDMWRDADPDHPGLPFAESQCRAAGGLWGLFSKGRK